MRTCFLGIPDIKKSFADGDPLKPDIQVHQPPCPDSEDPDEVDNSPKKKSTLRRSHNVTTKDLHFIYQSVFRPIEDETFVDRSLSKKYLFNDIDVIDDVSHGQRGFNRNIDRLGNQLISYYKRYYPQASEQTLFDIAKREEDLLLQQARDAKEAALN